MLCKEITKEEVERWQLVLLREPLSLPVFDPVHGSVCTSSGIREGSGVRHQAPVGSSGSGVDIGDLSSSGVSTEGRELPNISPALWWCPLKGPGF